MVKLGLDIIIGQQYDVRSLVSLFIDLMLSIQSWSADFLIGLRWYITGDDRLNISITQRNGIVCNVAFFVWVTTRNPIEVVMRYLNQIKGSLRF